MLLQGTCGLMQGYEILFFVVIFDLGRSNDCADNANNDIDLEDFAVNLLTNNLVQIEYYNKFQVIGLANLSGNFYLLYILIFVPYKKH